MVSRRSSCPVGTAGALAPLPTRTANAPGADARCSARDAIGSIKGRTSCEAIRRRPSDAAPLSCGHAACHIPLTYGVDANTMRACRGTRKDGSFCRAWAVWGDPRQLCVAHSGRPRGPRGRNHRPFAGPPNRPARHELCHCPAYAWPHRPAGGLCEWPRLEPRYICTTPAGTRSEPRWRSAQSRQWREFVREYRVSKRTGRLPRGILADHDAIAKAISGFAQDVPVEYATNRSGLGASAGGHAGRSR
jgi:hypothetical protein